MQEIEALLDIDSEDVSGILDEFIPDDCPSATPLNLKFYYIRFQENLPRITHLVRLLCDIIVCFCIKRGRRKEYNDKQIRKIYLDAKRRFAQPEDGKTGEPGELILYLLLEGCLRAPKILTKMSLKTNVEMHVHGSDGIHIGLENEYLVLYFGESKLNKVHTKAVSEALKSIKNFIEPLKPNTNYTQQDFEVDLISNELDVPEGELRDRILEILDPYSSERDKLIHKFAVLIGFDIDELAGKCDLTEFQALYQLKAKSCYDSLSAKISGDDVLNNLGWQFFFIPFGSVEKFRQIFLDELNS